MGAFIRRMLLACLIAICSQHYSKAQELFNYAEPASNMPAKSIGIRLSNFLSTYHGDKVLFQSQPEFMLGINKNLMIHAEPMFSNHNNKFDLQGGALYAKYRFLSMDEVHHHFRMATFARVSANKMPVHHQEIRTNGMNTGVEFGLIATQLIHKQALSATVAIEKITNNLKNNRLHINAPTTALNYSLSTGRLILPKKYTSYKQTNFNIMLEMIGQYIPSHQLHFVDLAPSLQFIINSQSRIDIGYRKQLYSNMTRLTKDVWMLRFEYLMFNALK
jgi:hypothetical protein